MTRHLDRSEQERRFCDELDLFWDATGGSRMAGRVLGALLLADPPQMSSAELVAFLGVSAGSVSTAVGAAAARPRGAARQRLTQMGGLRSADSGRLTQPR